MRLAPAAMDRFDALQAFARVVESGSFTKAALTLHLSRTTVTQLVQQLEARLLHSSRIQPELNPEGAGFADLGDAGGRSGP